MDREAEPSGIRIILSLNIVKRSRKRGRRKWPWRGSAAEDTYISRIRRVYRTIDRR